MAHYEAVLAMEAASAMPMDRLFDRIKQLPTIPKLLHEQGNALADLLTQ